MIGGTDGYSLLGTSILALVLYDVFTTVLHHWGRSGPASQRLVRSIGRSAVRLTAAVGAGAAPPDPPGSPVRW